MFKKVLFMKWLLSLLLFMVLSGSVQAKSVDLSAPYAIVVASSSKKFTKRDLRKAYINTSYLYYAVRVRSKTKKLYQMRFGFFESKKSAQKMQQTLKPYFSNTVIVKTTKNERNNALRSEILPSSNVQMAEYLILSTTFKTATSIAKVAGSALSEAMKPEVVDSQGEKQVEKVYDSYIVVNLKTTNNLLDFDKTIKHPEIKNHAFYISELKIEGSTWYQFRLGFFVDTTSARAKLDAISKDFPLARLIRVSREEKESATSRIRSFFAAVPTDKITKPLPKLAPVSTDKLKDLIKQGGKLLSAKDYSAAIAAYSKLLRFPENSYSMDAQEFLGFAYELNGDTSSARREYERYLSLYPETRGADRVRQRMASLITARADPKKDLRKRKRDIKNPKWQHFGSFAQFYRKDESRLNEEETRENLSLLSSDMNISSRYRSNNYIMNSRITGGHDLNATGEENVTSGSISSFYFDAASINSGWSGKLGRYSVSKDGVLGRMDGAQVSYKVNDYFKINTVAGYVVDKTDEGANKDKFFSGLSVDLGTFANAWDFNVYYIKQMAGEDNTGQDVVGREAVGSEIRYFHPQRTLFALIDYDVMFEETNTLLAIGNWIFDNKIQVNATVDIRKSPILTITNALTGRLTEQTLEELLAIRSEEEAQQLAIDQTATSKTIILGVNDPINDKFQISADVTMTSLSDSLSYQLTVLPAPPGEDVSTVVAGTNNEFYYNFQLIGSSIFMENDSSIFGFRHGDTDRSKSNSLNVNMRFPVTRNWRINPRFRSDKLKLSDGTDQTINALALRVDYRLKRNLNFELDMGGENSDRALDDTTSETRSYFVNVGYRYDF